MRTVRSLDAIPVGVFRASRRPLSDSSPRRRLRANLGPSLSKARIWWCRLSTLAHTSPMHIICARARQKELLDLLNRQRQPICTLFDPPDRRARARQLVATSRRPGRHGASRIEWPAGRAGPRRRSTPKTGGSDTTKAKPSARGPSSPTNSLGAGTSASRPEGRLAPAKRIKKEEKEGTPPARPPKL